MRITRGCRQELHMQLGVLHQRGDIAKGIVGLELGRQKGGIWQLRAR